ncbi:hypothetical protein VTN00DRAFT_6146 [Thermoascus crustaceus]|uniref:uncharacterized protein n=1 Tax=Thermoascus crustaceus TaxID=5088 RepID=UPI003743EEA5
MQNKRQQQKADKLNQKHSASQIQIPYPSWPAIPKPRPSKRNPRKTGNRIIRATYVHIHSITVTATVKNEKCKEKRNIKSSVPLPHYLFPRPAAYSRHPVQSRKRTLAV